MRWLEALLLVLALGLMAADGPLFPWVNLLGLGLFFGFVAITKRCNREGSHEELQADHRRSGLVQNP